MKTKMIVVFLALLLVLAFVLGCEKKSTLQDNVAALSSDNGKVDLPEDYDDGDVQVRHLSWGKFNYYPGEIHVKAGKPVRIVADTQRLSGCFRSLTIPDLNVNGQITEADNTIEFTPATKGTFGFGCAMGMGSGKLVVE